MATEPMELRRCSGVEVFTTRGLPGVYTAADLATVVDNFYLLGPFRLQLHRPPVGIGHDDDQAVLTALLESDPRLAPWLTAASLEGDDAPAAGWVCGLRAVPDPDAAGETVLVADFEDIPGPVADLIDARAYRRVSAEIYDDFTGGGTSYGKALRRVALVGWQPPVNKAMADVPPTVAQYAEPRRLQSTTRRPATTPGVYICFSENRAMDKTAKLAALKAKGVAFSDAVATAMTDAEVNLLYKKFAEPVPAPAVPPVTKMDEPPTRDQMIAEMQAAGQDANQLAALDDATLATMYQQWKAQQPGPQPAAAMAEVKKYAEQVKTLVTTLNVEIAKAKTASEQVKKYAEETAKMHKASKVAAARLDLVGANGSGVAHCTPAEFDTIHRPTLESLDDLTVQKFAEGSRTFEGTAFANYVAKLKALPPKKVFAEKVGDPAGSTGGSAGDAGLDAEKQKVRVFAEANAGDLKKFQLTPAAFVDRFEKLKKADPDLTAEKYTAGL